MLRQTASRPVYLGVKLPSGAQDQSFIAQTFAGLLMWGALSDGRTSLLFRSIAVLGRAVILGSESRGTHGRILLSQIRDYPNLEGQFPVFVPLGTSAPLVLVSLFGASYESHGYGGGIRTRPLTR
jgi:hypothetical protein